MRITYYGSAKQKERSEALVNSLNLTGNEGADRLIIQEALDNATGTGIILYDGNTVYPSKKLVKELNRMKKTGSIEKMSNEMYKFLSTNFDIAHYNKFGFIDYYDGNFESMRQAILVNPRIPSWHTDITKILKEAELCRNL
ncbi:MAG: hypothetical protein IK121_11000 [Lachnospiraceae bacterium]|nr:hypothetical protein [Lachnospiraceae bacterium]